MKKLNNTYYSNTIVTKRNKHFNKYSNSDGVTDIMLAEIMTTISSIKKYKLLDLGTGNGFIIREILNENPKAMENSVLIGVDNSQPMLDDAKGRLIINHPLARNVQFIKMDNNNLKFEDDYFDVVTAKAVTCISLEEVHRVLRPGGWFIYKEYGLGKGLVELMKLINDVNKQHPGDDLVDKIQQCGFNESQIRKYYIPVERSIDEIKSLLSTMRILPEGTKDYQRILSITEEYYKGDSCKKVHSDPYLILARK